LRFCEKYASFLGHIFLLSQEAILDQDFLVLVKGVRPLYLDLTRALLKLECKIVIPVNKYFYTLIRDSPRRRQCRKLYPLRLPAEFFQNGAILLKNQD